MVGSRWTALGRTAVSSVASVLQTPLPISQTAGYALEGLPNFAGQISRAARRHQRHVAGVEICSEGWNDAARSARTARGRGIRGAVGVDVEGAIFLDEPAVVGDRVAGSCRSAVENGYGQIARRREDQRHGCGCGALRPLRVLRLVGEGVGAWGGDVRNIESAIWIHRQRARARSGESRYGRRIDRKRIARRVRCQRTECRMARSSGTSPRWR